MGNPNIDPRVAPHDASYLTNISFIVIMYVNHFSIIICEQHRFFFFFCGFQCQSYDFKSINKITEIVREIWLVKNLSFIIPVNP